MGWIRSERVHSALKSLGDWHASAPNQGSKHLLPLLALLEKGAGVGSVKIEFKERPDEYNFWDRYFKLGGDEKKPWGQHWRDPKFRSGAAALAALPKKLRDEFVTTKRMYAVFGPRDPTGGKGGRPPTKRKPKR